MRRNISNDLIVALAVIGTIAVAIAFGVILIIGPDIGGGQDNALAATATFLAANRPTATKRSDFFTAYAITSQPSATFTISPTFTPSHTHTATFTPTASPSDTVTPSETSTPSHTPTATQTASTTPTPSNTLPPTDTATPSDTPTPSNTPTDTLTPSITPTPSDTPLPPNIRPNCSPPAGWVPYIVQAGENLYRIALRYGTTYPKLQEANCLMTDAIYVGQQLYLPPVTPNLPAPTPLGATPGLRTMSDTSAQEGSACIDENSRITSPAPEQAVSGTFQIYGTATVENFDFYKLEIRPDGRSAYATVEQYDTPVINGLLGEINTAAFGPGQYWVRLVVVDITGNYPHTPCAIRLDFE